MGGSDCESLTDGWLAQPVNAWSSLAFGLAGVYLLTFAIRSTTIDRRWLVLGGVALVLVSAGSFAYHGPQPSWAGVLHDGSIVLLVAIVLASLWTRPMAPSTLRLAAGVLAVGGAAWVFGRTGGPLCRPESLLQPHAAWHVMAAVAAAPAVLGSTAGRALRPRGVR